MKHLAKIRTFAILLVVLMNIGCDQVSKTIVRNEVAYNENIKFISNNFTLTRVENTGAFLSIGNALPAVVKFTLLALLPSIILLYGLYYLISRNKFSRLFLTGACFVIGGGIGNLYDRILYGSVTDFLHIDFGIFQTGVFNLADVSVMFGVLVILIDLRFRKSAPENNEAVQLS